MKNGNITKICLCCMKYTIKLYLCYGIRCQITNNENVFLLIDFCTSYNVIEIWFYCIFYTTKIYLSWKGILGIKKTKIHGVRVEKNEGENSNAFLKP